MATIKGGEGGDSVKSVNQMNVLGVIFDSKLTWSAQVLNSILKANKALHAIRLIKNLYNDYEPCRILASSSAEGM